MSLPPGLLSKGTVGPVRRLGKAAGRAAILLAHHTGVSAPPVLVPASITFASRGAVVVSGRGGPHMARSASPAPAPRTSSGGAV
jgi:hypothetical protein